MKEEKKEVFEQEIPVEKVCWKNKMFGMVCYIGIIVLLSWFLIHFVVQRTVVSGHSMNPTLENQDNLLVDKLSYRFGDIQRFDIIVFEVPFEKGTYYIKRVIGLPGETIQIQGDRIFVNGVLLEENYGKEPMLDNGRADVPITLGDGEYFVLGDNRNNSTDSRSNSVANVSRGQIVGKAWIRIFPFSQFGILRHQ